MSKINRREFMAVAAGAAVAVSSAKPTTLSEKLQKPMNWKRGRSFCWTHIDLKATTADLNTKYAKLAAHGMSGVFAGGGIDEREFDIIREAGLELHAWMWTTNRGDQWIRDNHPDWYMVSRSGKSCFDQPPYVDYYRWISPVIPGVQRYLAEKTAELAVHPLVNGVHFDYVRYPDVILPRGLWDHYKLDQTEELADYDFCYSDHTRAAFKEATGRDPLEIKNPSTDQEWLHFRQDSVTKLVKKLTKVIHGYGKFATAAVFPTPSMARKICRQDWDKWPLDAACPMIYHSFYNQGIDFIGDCLRENVEAATFPIQAGLYLPAFTSQEEFRKALDLVRHRGGAGVSLFSDPNDAYLETFQKWQGEG